jgi:hypothetical protein
LGVDVLADILCYLDIMNFSGKLPLPPWQHLDQPTRQRLSQWGLDSLKVYGYLVILAPQNVLDANDSLRDHIDSILFKGEKYYPPKVHQLALDLVNAIREDIGIVQGQPVKYKGQRYT